MAANRGSDGREDNEASTQHGNAGEPPSEGRGRDMKESVVPMTGPLSEPAVTPETTSVLTMIPVPTSMVRQKTKPLYLMTTLTGWETPVTVPDVPGLRVNIVPGLDGAKIEIHPLNVGIDPLVCRKLGTDCYLCSRIRAPQRKKQRTRPCRVRNWAVPCFWEWVLHPRSEGGLLLQPTARYFWERTLT